jgi:hypothetical protein
MSLLQVLLARNVETNVLDFNFTTGGKILSHFWIVLFEPIKPILADISFFLELDILVILRHSESF